MTASTGIAATHINGTTLHSFAGVGLGSGVLDRTFSLKKNVFMFFLFFLQGDSAQVIARVMKKSSTVNRWKSCRVLVIDEISMVSAEFFELLDEVGQGVVCLMSYCAVSFFVLFCFVLFCFVLFRFVLFCFVFSL